MLVVNVTPASLVDIWDCECEPELTIKSVNIGNNVTR